MSGVFDVERMCLYDAIITRSSTETPLRAFHVGLRSFKVNVKFSNLNVLFMSTHVELELDILLVKIWVLILFPKSYDCIASCMK